MTRVYPLPDHIRYGEVVLRGNRLYFVKPGMDIDVTALYWFLKEMFTSDWKETK